MKYTYLHRLIKNKNYLKETDYIRKLLEKNIDEEILYKCYIMLKASEGSEVKIFLRLEVKEDLSDIDEVYQNIKFCIRRFEYDLDDIAIQQALEYLQYISISAYTLYYIMQYVCIKRNVVLVRIIEKMYSYNMKYMAKALESYVQ